MNRITQSTANPPSTINHRQSFTLIELLVVVAILAVLLALLLPALTSARENTKIVTCGTHVRDLVTGSLMYANDYHDFLPQPWGPPTWHNGYFFYKTDPVHKWRAFGALAAGNYLKSKYSFFCPADNSALTFSSLKYWDWYSTIRCSYEYRSDPGTPDGYPFRLGVYHTRGAFIADGFTSDWSSWRCSHNNPAANYSYDYTQPPWPRGFNIGYDDGGVKWFSFEFGAKPWPGASESWTPNAVEFFKQLDGSN